MLIVQLINVHKVPDKHSAQLPKLRSRLAENNTIQFLKRGNIGEKSSEAVITKGSY